MSVIEFQWMWPPILVHFFIYYFSSNSLQKQNRRTSKLRTGPYLMFSTVYSFVFVLACFVCVDFGHNFNFSFSRKNSLSNLLLRKSRFPKKYINFSSLKSLYHRLANRKELNLSQEKYFKTLKGSHWHYKHITF